MPKEDWVIVDSAKVSYDDTVMHFKIPVQEEAVFYISIRNKPIRLVLINDVEEINIRWSKYDASDYTFHNDGISSSLSQFISTQAIIEKQMGVVLEQKNKLNPVSQEYSFLSKRSDSMRVVLQHNAKTFADTTHSAGAFIYTYSKIDFGSDYKSLKNIAEKASQRYPNHQRIQKITQQALKVVKIFEEEYKVGDALPFVTLTDINDQPSSTANLQGKYVLIDFWSTWCTPCLQYIKAKQEVNKALGTHVQLVSIALDDQKENWKTMVQQYQIPGVHLIDEEMWHGKTAEAYKMDSIPFNFLISPEGKILAKAIKPDSVLTVIRSFMPAAAKH
jgi:thiol-disulfide isomerase/thioredoxin